MSKELRILILEDNSLDADLVENALSGAGLVFTSEIVDKKETFLKALDEFIPELILSDYDLSTFDGLQALEIAKEKCPDVPFILVTGRVGEEFAIETLKKGVTDYVMKGNLKRLVPAINRALEEAELIANRKKAEKELWESQERYRALVDNTKLGIAVMDTNYRIIMVNPTFAKLFKKSASDFSGNYCFREFEKRDAVCPHCPGTKAMVSGKTEEVKTQGVLDDGSRFYAHNRAAPFFESDGTLKGFIEMVEDITERKRIEETLRESEERFKQVADAAREWIWEVDTEGLYTYSSSAVEKILGYKPEQIIGKKYFFDFFIPEEKDDLKKAAFEVFSRKEPFAGFVNRNIHLNGNTAKRKISKAVVKIQYKSNKVGTPLKDGNGISDIIKPETIIVAIKITHS